MSQLVHWGNCISIELTPEWVYEQDAESESPSVTIFHTVSGAGALQISFAELEGVTDATEYTVETLQLFIRGQQGNSSEIEVGSVNGVVTGHVSLVTPDDYWEAWVMTDSHQRAFITYNCDKADMGVEKRDYGRLLSTIRWKP